MEVARRSGQREAVARGTNTVEKEGEVSVERLAGEMVPSEDEGLLEVPEVEEELVVAAEVLLESGRHESARPADLVAEVDFGVGDQVADGGLQDKEGDLLAEGVLEAVEEFSQAAMLAVDVFDGGAWDGVAGDGSHQWRISSRAGAA